MRTQHYEKIEKIKELERISSILKVKTKKLVNFEDLINGYLIANFP